MRDLRRWLHDAGLRDTAPRREVLTYLSERPHSTAADIAAAVGDRLGALSTQAVYNILSACVGAGLVRQIEPAGSAALYETRTGDNHHHVVCRSCGAVSDVDCLLGKSPCLDLAEEFADDPASSHGFAVDEAEILFWGRCPPCQANPVSEAARTRSTRSQGRPRRDSTNQR